MYVSEMGNSEVRQLQGSEAALAVNSATSDVYSNAQIASYQTPQQFSYDPPLRMTVTAYAVGELLGTAGFGFWNHPFVPGERGFRMPKAIWFFHASPPNNMALAKGIPGYGWKCATFDATRWQFLLMLPAAPIGFLLMRIPAIYNALWGIGQAAIGVSECLLDETLLKTSHTYTIDWLPNQVQFMVDDQIVHQSPYSPRGNLGFVAWVDNQYAIVTPQGQFGFGLVNSAQSQSLILEQVKITPL